ncbi:hydroxymethylpyrimidine/phosphomethylpyrimidine kinase [Kineococcus xinjiangensis]|uniref:Hydroxymethylpyrimidine/phosphomethylpyrimidine kinase n=1 Tax=Kineococcus xinjiangensis TaxID=512762 RepID=A0A2S6ID34_9ACTN|nr:bifunctional hydroxymethylpyrimidine kinase/phosphomethylpyrimidine kinase [Kineococcus xinjiangensis]PPK92083.1 hydroxymethylpyrimidine/phosphomethylpyrimidine kinase [Kineococcus xinjiangensis]
MTASIALTIAGSDPSGGAGIQADLKAFSALGAYGTAVLTALTAQSTRGVFGVHPVPPEFLRQQLDVLLDDLDVRAVKIGMLGSAPLARTVAEVLRRAQAGPVVLDPVMVATSGDRLLDDDAVEVIARELLPLADLVTPNAPEAAVLLGEPTAPHAEAAVAQAEELHRRGAKAVLLKGGHFGGTTSTDVLVDAGGTRLLQRERIDTPHTHGTGCTLSSAIAALAAVRGAPAGGDWHGLVAEARDYLHAALLAGRDLHVGGGHGPVHHFHPWWPA